MCTEKSVQGSLEEDVGKIAGTSSTWRRRLIRLGVYGLFAALAGTAVMATAAPAAPSRTAGITAVNIICKSGTGGVTKTDDPAEPGEPVKYQARGSCDVTGTENGIAIGTATFSIPRNNCAGATTNVTAKVTWPDGQTSTGAGTVVWTATAGHGLSGSIASGSITGGAFTGAMVKGDGIAPEQVRLDCISSGTFAGATGSGSGAVT
ncbi:hypothetical protein [Streptomyces sp. A1-5]|uniref:hypothetical protein n=1 Tax=Streptomyces sp. A1-5 TaxID=2738410 RepID=UPI001F252655|nr:hypothetical protein [Streptomyces sp. A1-5]UJB44811.1 hypothetical protein HRD51_32050 [Streptomyces sp. A1-5]